MFKCGVNITVGKYSFDYMVDFTSTSSWENLTDTCIITIPRKVKWGNKNIYLGDEGLLKKGDAVELKWSYDGRWNTVFKGYLKNVYSDTPVRLECEDAMWMLKQNPVTKSYRSVTLKQLLSDIVPKGIEIVQPKDVALGQFRINKATPAKVLDELRSAYGIYSFFKDGKLYSGLAYWFEYQKVSTFRFDLHILPGHSLQYLKDEDTKYKVNAISFYPDNTKIEKSFGDEDGDLRTLHFYNVKEKDLEAISNSWIKTFKKTGYSGSFTTFAEPFVKQGEAALLIDSKYPEREGIYLIKSVKYQGGMTGLRQTIELDIRLT